MVLLVASKAVQPKFVIEKLLYIPSPKSVKVKALLVTITLLGLVVPVVVKVSEYVPLGKLVVVKSISPSVAVQFVGLVDVPAVSVGEAGFDKVFNVATEPVQPERVTEKLL